MPSLLLHAAFSLLLEFIVRRATYKVLDMKSIPAYLALCFACWCTAYAMQISDFSHSLRAFIMGPFTNFLLPFIMSRGPAGLRITRIAFINVTVLLTEIAGSVLYYAMTGRAFPSSLLDLDSMTILIIYTVLTILTTVTCEACITFFRHTDSRWDNAFEPAALTMMVGTFSFFCLLIVRYDLVGVSSFMVPLVTVFCVFFAVVGSYAMLVVARHDAQAKRDIALQTAKKRQLKHLMKEVANVTTRSVRIRHLRHDLANQIGVVRALASQGHVDEADRYLAALQERAHSIADPVQEAAPYE